MEPADCDLHAGRAQRSGDVHGTGKFVRLRADNPNQPQAAVFGDAADDVFRLHAGVGLVHGVDVDGKVGAQQLPFGGALREAVYRGKRI